MSDPHEHQRAQELLAAVERILESPEKLIARVETTRAKCTKKDPAHVERWTSSELIQRYSNKSGLSGSMAALPALIPGAGTLAALAGGTLVDVALMLKFEVEMSMCLAYLYGFDIREERERRIAFLMACVKTHDVKTGGNILLDVAAAEGVAIWNYASRELTKLLITVLTKIALVGIGKGLIRAVPLVGVVVGGSMNKILTTSVGKRICGELERRREFPSTTPHTSEG